MSERLYFAYGSNINLDQMAHRCPNAEVIGPVTLNGYRLAFRSRSGVATILPAPAKQVKGLLWRLTPECEKALDHYEGYPHFYHKDESVNVIDRAGREYEVMAYIMGREYEKAPHMPSLLYFVGIAEGYKQNGIPTQSLYAALDNCKLEVEERQKAEVARKQAQALQDDDSPFQLGFNDFGDWQATKRKPTTPER